MVCERRTSYFDSIPEHRAANGLPAGPLPHVFGSRIRTWRDGVPSEWSRRKCSWCGQVAAP